VLQLPQRLGLDLADALARHREPQADLFQRVIAKELQLFCKPGATRLHP
jgi:hypothetical protein